MKKIRVLFLSVQPSIVLELMRFFTSDPLVIPNLDEYNNFDKHRKKYDVVVFDDGSLKNNESGMLRRILSAKGNYKKILYTYSADKDYLHFFESGGIDGIVSKRAGSEILKEAIIKTKEGEKYLCEYVKNFLYGNNVADEKNKKLTKREREILYLVKEGLTDKEIAERLSISPNTVVNHKQNIKNKFNLKSVNELYKIL